MIRLKEKFCKAWDPEYIRNLKEISRKIGKNIKQQVTKEEIQMVNNHMKRLHHEKSRKNTNQNHEILFHM